MNNKKRNKQKQKKQKNPPIIECMFNNLQLSTRNLENFDELLTQRRPEIQIKNCLEYDKNLSINEKDSTKLGTKRSLNGVEINVDEGENSDGFKPPPFKKANKIGDKNERRVSGEKRKLEN